MQCHIRGLLIEQYGSKTLFMLEVVTFNRTPAVYSTVCHPIYLGLHLFDIQQKSLLHRSSHSLDPSVDLSYHSSFFLLTQVVKKTISRMSDVNKGRSAKEHVEGKQQQPLQQPAVPVVVTKTLTVNGPDLPWRTTNLVLRCSDLCPLSKGHSLQGNTAHFSNLNN
ncbi:hypothetical protein LOAG_10403 [Loa loa]|uniref:Uncharacterized protein n=1 Tax=Loa loa TaxID=7209 RepID=A0A1S0TRH9_LOALO|nr:hypothetical protein LOAG_10403 [Loa loa]EFO18096.1 hypothetical protein LOAG_10403 [Loa loa]